MCCFSHLLSVASDRAETRSTTRRSARGHSGSTIFQNMRDKWLDKWLTLINDRKSALENVRFGDIFLR